MYERGARHCPERCLGRYRTGVCAGQPESVRGVLAEADVEGHVGEVLGVRREGDFRNEVAVLARQPRWAEDIE